MCDFQTKENLNKRREERVYLDDRSLVTSGLLLKKKFFSFCCLDFSFSVGLVIKLSSLDRKVVFVAFCCVFVNWILLTSSWTLNLCPFLGSDIV